MKRLRLPLVRYNYRLPASARDAFEALAGVHAVAELEMLLETFMAAPLPGAASTEIAERLGDRMRRLSKALRVVAAAVDGPRAFVDYPPMALPVRGLSEWTKRVLDRGILDPKRAIAGQRQKRSDVELAVLSVLERYGVKTGGSQRVADLLDLILRETIGLSSDTSEARRQRLLAARKRRREGMLGTEARRK